MLAAPIVNPIVLVSTYVAFRGQNPMEFTLSRLGVGYLVAVIVALGCPSPPATLALAPRGLLWAWDFK